VHPDNDCFAAAFYGFRDSIKIFRNFSGMIDPEKIGSEYVSLFAPILSPVDDRPIMDCCDSNHHKSSYFYQFGISITIKMFVVNR